MNKETPQNEIVTEPFLKEKKFLAKEETPVQELQEFVLLLMKNNGHTEILQNVKPGEFLMKNKSGTQEKSILLTPNKLTTFNYNKQYFKGWVVHEDNMSPYPEEPLHNGEMFRKLSQKIAMNYKDANEAKVLEASTKRTVTLIVLGVIVLFVIYTMMKNNGVFAAKTAQVVTQTAINTTKAAITNTTGVTVT